MNAICLNTALVNKSSARKMCSNVTPKSVKAERLIVTKAHVDRITINVKFFGVRRVRHQINATIRTRTEVGMGTADTIE